MEDYGDEGGNEYGAGEYALSWQSATFVVQSLTVTLVQGVR